MNNFNTIVAAKVSRHQEVLVKISRPFSRSRLKTACMWFGGQSGFPCGLVQDTHPSLMKLYWHFYLAALMWCSLSPGLKPSPFGLDYLRAKSSRDNYSYSPVQPKWTWFCPFVHCHCHCHWHCGTPPLPHSATGLHRSVCRGVPSLGYDSILSGPTWVDPFNLIKPTP
jgi:hypothetical protein